MTFGRQTNQLAANAMVDRCIDAGINFFDTANTYEHGKSEVKFCGARSALPEAP
jgi:aryl-alcohol dehydrogenase-like predicted oxidoreductase